MQMRLETATEENTAKKAPNGYEAMRLMQEETGKALQGLLAMSVGAFMLTF